MTYYVGSMPVGEDELMHYGIKGMRWGRRNFQNRDGSLTAAGRQRYGVRQRVRGVITRGANASRAHWGSPKQRKQTARKVAKYMAIGAAGAGAAYLGAKYGKRAFSAAKRMARGTPGLTRYNPSVNRKARIRGVIDDAFKSGRKANQKMRPVKTAASEPWFTKGVDKKVAKASAKARRARIRGQIDDAFAGTNVGKAKTKRAGVRRTVKNAKDKLGNVVRRSRSKGAESGFIPRAGKPKKAPKVRNGKWKEAGTSLSTQVKQKRNFKQAASDYAKRAGEKAKRAGQRAGNTKAGKRMKARVNAHRWAMKNMPGAYAVNTAYNVGMGGLYYGHARRAGKSKKQAAAVGVTRAATGRILPAMAVGAATTYYNKRRKKGTRKSK